MVAVLMRKAYTNVSQTTYRESVCTYPKELHSKRMRSSTVIRLHLNAGISFAVAESMDAMNFHGAKHRFNLVDIGFLIQSGDYGYIAGWV